MALVRGWGPFGTGYYRAPVLTDPFGLIGDRPFFLYWQTWAVGFAALGLGIIVGMVW